MPVRLLYTTGPGGDTAVYTFPDHAVAARWNALVTEIKAEASTVFNKAEEAGRSPNARDFAKFFVKVDLLTNGFGPNSVPRDIRRSVNDIEKNLSLPITSWP